MLFMLPLDITRSDDIVHNAYTIGGVLHSIRCKIITAVLPSQITVIT